MSVLSDTTQAQVEENLVSEGILTLEDITTIKDTASKQGMPFLSILVGSGKVSNEQLTKSIATVTKVPYVNLSNARIEPAILELLPQDIAERYMAVPLGEMQHRLVVAMLDAANVQAVDFLSNRIGRPLKVYAASESGVRQVLRQYGARLESTMGDALTANLSNIGAENAAETK